MGAMRRWRWRWRCGPAEAEVESTSASAGKHPSIHSDCVRVDDREQHAADHDRWQHGRRSHSKAERQRQRQPNRRTSIHPGRRRRVATSPTVRCSRSRSVCVRACEWDRPVVVLQCVLECGWLAAERTAASGAEIGGGWSAWGSEQQQQQRRSTQRTRWDRESNVDCSQPLLESSGGVRQGGRGESGVGDAVDDRCVSAGGWTNERDGADLSRRRDSDDQTDPLPTNVSNQPREAYR